MEYDRRPPSRTGSGGDRTPARPRSSDAIRRYGPAVAGYALPFLLVVYLGDEGRRLRPDRPRRGRGRGLVGGPPRRRRRRAAGGPDHGRGLGRARAAGGVRRLDRRSGSPGRSRPSAAPRRRAASPPTSASSLLAISAQGGDGGAPDGLRRSAPRSAWSACSRCSRGCTRAGSRPTTRRPTCSPQGRRLNYPLDYWNGLAALIAIGIPLCSGSRPAARHVVAARARRRGAAGDGARRLLHALARRRDRDRASRLIVLFALLPAPARAAADGARRRGRQRARRSPRPPSATRSRTGSPTPPRLAGLRDARVVAGRLRRRRPARRPRSRSPSATSSAAMPRVSRPTALGARAAVVVVCLIGALALGAPGKISDGWDEFKATRAAATTTAQRFESASGNGRYQYWQSAVDANATEPLTGIGPGPSSSGGRGGHACRASCATPTRSTSRPSASSGSSASLLIVGLSCSCSSPGRRRALAGRPERASAARRRDRAAASRSRSPRAIDWVWELPVLPVVLPAARRGDRSRAERRAEAGRPLASGCRLGASARRCSRRGA